MAAGLVNGFLARTRVPPFMITMATMLFYFSLANLLTGASLLNLHRLQRFINTAFGLNKLGEAAATAVWLVLSVLLILVLGRARYGQNVYAVGGKELAARLSGIRTGAVRLSVYVASGFF
jgi:ribose transport system permease protein